MDRLTRIRPLSVEFIPEVLEHGVLYVSEKYRTATHLCCCGCGSKVVTPLKDGFWQSTLTYDYGVLSRVSLHPSIGSFNLPCRSHYFIRDNEVVWC